MNSSTPLALEELRNQRTRLKRKIHLLEEALGSIDRLIVIAEGKPVKGSQMTTIGEKEKQLQEA